MELIEIISTILLFGGGLLVFVVLVSFFSSKMKANEEDSQYVRRKQQNSSKDSMRRFKTVTPILPRNNREQLPQIFQIEQLRPREIKVVRKPTFRETKSEDSATSTEQRKITNEKNRYTIVNEEQKKSRNKAANFN